MPDDTVSLTDAPESVLHLDDVEGSDPGFDAAAAAGRRAHRGRADADLHLGYQSSSPLIGQACCIGDRRPYNTALIVLDADFAPAWAAQNDLQDRSLEQLATEPAVIEVVQTAIDAANTRKPIAAKYAAEIDRMYAG